MTHLKLKKRSGVNSFENQMREVQVKSMLFKQDEGLVLITTNIDLSLNPIFIFDKLTPPKKNTLCQQVVTGCSFSLYLNS